jgi:hypothetical protein
MYLNPEETWYGSALAIKYSNNNLTETTTEDGKITVSTPASNSTSTLKGETDSGNSEGKKGLFGLFK